MHKVTLGGRYFSKQLFHPNHDFGKTRSYNFFLVLFWFRRASEQKDSMAQWIRRWSTKPEILGSIPSGVVFALFMRFR
jgi:transcriptional regulator GlxA family with amidase domain